MRSCLLFALFLAGCGTTRNRPMPPRAAPPEPVSAKPVSTEPASDEVTDASAKVDSSSEEGTPASPESADTVNLIARVDGEPVLVSELLGAWLHRESRSVRGYLEELILSRIILLEAAKLGVNVPQTALDEALTDATDHLREEVTRAGGTSVDEFLQQRLGLEPRRYLAVLREQTVVDLTAARVVRAWLFGSDRVEVRVIVTETEEAMNDARAALDGGEDFQAVCARYSIEQGAEAGGRVPPVVRGPTAMARLAFSTPVGSVGGPVFEGDRWLLLSADARPVPVRGPWTEIGPLVEASLADHGIEDPEYWQWKASVLERYEVDMAPMLELTGGALAD